MFAYDVAISFAGEDREFARYMAARLRPHFSVFFDEFERADLWGGRSN